MTAPDNPNPNRELALALAAAGVPVFPCLEADGTDKGAKAPYTLNGFKDARTNLDIVEQWWRRWPTAVPGIPTGAASGLAVIDCDIDRNTGETIGEDQVAELGLDHPHAVHSRTQSGGQHIIFAHAEGVGTNAKKVASHVDLRGDGGYIIAPGAKMANGAEYRCEGRSFFDALQAGDLPAFPVEEANAAIDARKERASKGGKRQAAETKTSGTKATDEETIEVLRTLLAEAPNDLTRTDWVKLALSLRDAFDGSLRDDFMAFSLRYTGETLCTPKAAEKVWDSAHAATEIEGPGTALWLLKGAVGTPRFKAIWRETFARTRGCHSDERDLPDPPLDPELLEDVSEVAQVAAADDLSDVVLPGLLGELQDKLRRGIERKAIMMPLAGAFAAQAALVGPYATLQANDGSTPLNLFLTVFADTGSGKTTVRAVLKTHLNAAQRGNEMQTDPASGPAVHQALLNTKGVLTVMQDEAGRRKAENKSSSNSHAAGAMTALMDLYGNEPIGIEQKTYSNVKDTKPAIAPVFLTFVRMSQRELYLDAAGELDSASGELNRFLIFSERETLELRDEEPDRDGLYELGPLGEVAAALFMAPALYRVELTMTDEAWKVYKAFRMNDCEEAYQRGGHFRQSWPRAPLHAKRLAGHIALSAAIGAGVEQVENKLLIRAEVEAEHMELAVRIVRACLNEVTGVAKRAAHGSRAALKDEVVEFIRTEVREGRGVGRGLVFVKRSTITKGISRFSRMNAADKRDFFIDMVDEERLANAVVKHPNGGPPAAVYAVRKGAEVISQGSAR